MSGLLDFLQAASNSAASNVSAPVDGIAWLLRKAGIPVPEDAVGGSKWMEQKGLTRPVQQGTAQVLGETAGLLGPIAVAAKAPQIAKGLLQAGDNLAAPRTLNPQKGAIVWHGSPHKFDRFDSSKIGTGEGAQAYGHGLYLAESPDVAQQYQRALSGRDLTEVGGQRVADLQISDDAKSFVQQVAANVQRGKTLDQAVGVLRKNIELGHPNAKAMQEALSVLGGGVTRGNIYKVDLPDSAIARMLDWDKPLSQQAQTAKALRPLAGRVRGLDDALQPFELDSTTGRTVNDYISRALSPADAAALFKQAGIPGIRYLDGGSRGAGQGTSNYVIFPQEEGLLTILERNGIPLR